MILSIILFAVAVGAVVAYCLFAKKNPVIVKKVDDIAGILKK